MMQTECGIENQINAEENHHCHKHTSRNFQLENLPGETVWPVDGC